MSVVVCPSLFRTRLCLERRSEALVLLLHSSVSYRIWKAESVSLGFPEAPAAKHLHILRHAYMPSFRWPWWGFRQRRSEKSPKSQSMSSIQEAGTVDISHLPTWKRHIILLLQINLQFHLLYSASLTKRQQAWCCFSVHRHATLEGRVLHNTSTAKQELFRLAVLRNASFNLIIEGSLSPSLRLSLCETYSLSWELIMADFEHSLSLSLSLSRSPPLPLSLSPSLPLSLSPSLPLSLSETRRNIIHKMLGMQ